MKLLEETRKGDWVTDLEAYSSGANLNLTPEPELLLLCDNGGVYASCEVPEVSEKAHLVTFRGSFKAGLRFSCVLNYDLQDGKRDGVGVVFDSDRGVCLRDLRTGQVLTKFMGIEQFVVRRDEFNVTVSVPFGAGYYGLFSCGMFRACAWKMEDFSTGKLAVHVNGSNSRLELNRIDIETSSVPKCDGLHVCLREILIDRRDNWVVLPPAQATLSNIWSVVMRRRPSQVVVSAYEQDIPGFGKVLKPAPLAEVTETSITRSALEGLLTGCGIPFQVIC